MQQYSRILGALLVKPGAGALEWVRATVADLDAGFAASAIWRARLSPREATSSFRRATCVMYLNPAKWPGSATTGRMTEDKASMR